MVKKYYTKHYKFYNPIIESNMHARYRAEPTTEKNWIMHKPDTNE